MASRADDREFEAASHHWLAQVAEMAGDLPLADAQFQRASNVFKTLGSNQTSLSAQTTTDVERASLEVSRGDFDSAAARLQRIKGALAGVTNSYASMLYYLSLGELHLHQEVLLTSQGLR